MENVLKMKSVTYRFQGSHTGQLDFCNWLADRIMKIEIPNEQ